MLTINQVFKEQVNWSMPYQTHMYDACMSGTLMLLVVIYDNTKRPFQSSNCGADTIAAGYF